jgi:DNA polymerase alpha subunit A
METPIYDTVGEDE